MIKKILKIFLSIILIIFVFNMLFPIYIYFITEPQKLYNAINSANKIVITKKNDNRKVIYTSTNIKDIQSFKRSLNLEKRIEWSFPSCRGIIGINFYNDKQQVSRIAYLTNSHIRDEQVGYIAIKNKQALEKWFHNRNISTVHNK